MYWHSRPTLQSFSNSSTTTCTIRTQSNKGKNRHIQSGPTELCLDNKIDIFFFRNFTEESNSITKSKLNSSEDTYTLTWYTTQLMEEHRYITFNSYNELFTTGIIPLFALCFFNYKVSPMPCFHFNQFLSMKTFLICRFTMRSSPLPISA